MLSTRTLAQRVVARQRIVQLDVERYRTPDGIVRFVREVLGVDGQTPDEPNYLAPYQEDILRQFVARHRAAVRGPHGLGKTALSSWIILWAISCLGEDVKVVTTASAWRQLEHYTWPEVRKWAQRADWSLTPVRIQYKRELLELGIKLPGREAFAVASDNPALIEGAHARVLVYVFDEAKAIVPGTWDAAEGAFSTGDAYALAISTPGEPSGRFYDIHARKPGYGDWWVRHVTLAEAIVAGRIRPEWADQRRQQWGETSAVYQNRVLGEFAQSGEDSVIPLAWIELANERFRERGGKGEGKTTYGCDPARYGEDQTATARLVGRVLEALDQHAQQDTMQTAGRLAATIGANATGIDTIGLGAGVFDRLREQKFNVVSVNVAESTDLRDASDSFGFVNLRSAIWWMLREALDPSGPDPLALLPDDLLTGDLTAPTWTYTSTGRVKVESKDEMRARLGRSTDSADALGLALYVGQMPKKRSALWD